MAEKVEETRGYITFEFTCWKRTFRICLSKKRSIAEILFFKRLTNEDQSVPDVMKQLYTLWESQHECGELGVYKATDLVLVYGIREV